MMGAKCGSSVAREPPGRRAGVTGHSRPREDGIGDPARNRERDTLWDSNKIRCDP
jgi:hypothetical protein